MNTTTIETQELERLKEVEGDYTDLLTMLNKRFPRRGNVLPDYDVMEVLSENFALKTVLETVIVSLGNKLDDQIVALQTQLEKVRQEREWIKAHVKAAGWPEDIQEMDTVQLVQWLLGHIEDLGK